MPNVPVGRIVRLIIAIVAAVLFFSAGQDMRHLQSQSGNTVAEAFDQAMGLFAWGMAALSLLLGIPASLSDPVEPRPLAMESGSQNVAPES